MISWTRIINFKDKLTHVQPLLHDMKALNIFQINLFHIIYFMFQYKKKIDPPPIFHGLFTEEGTRGGVIKKERGDFMGKAII